MLSTLPEKIDFLMTLTATRTSTLARALNYDPSYVSRIRSGKRGIPTHQPFLEPASRYFAKAIREEYQKTAAAEAMQLQAAWPAKEAQAAKYILSWLQGEELPIDPLTKMVASLQGIQGSQKKMNGSKARKEEKTQALLFFGDEGKRTGVLAFLTDLVRSGKPCTLLLHSDENMTWLTEDPEFAAAWTQLLLKIAANGGRIRIIHSISRSLNEMWEAVRKWIPLYMTGAIEPYYYPLLRDGVFMRTTFIAEGRSALVSDSVQGQKGDPLSFLMTDRHAIRALEDEFAAFLALCRPLMEIVTPESEEELETLKRAFCGPPGEVRTAEMNGMQILMHPGSTALLLKTQAPYAAFAISEPRMVAALEFYLQNCQ